MSTHEVRRPEPTTLKLEVIIEEIERIGARFDQISDNIFQYTILIERPVAVGNRRHFLVIKAIKPTVDSYVLKVSVLEESSYLILTETGQIGMRSPKFPGWNHFSIEDEQLTEGEVMFRYLKLDPSSPLVKVYSNLEVLPRLRGLGFGKMLFETYERIVRILMKNLPELSGREVCLLVRESSQTDKGEGWTTEMALRMNYDYVGISTFPTFQKVLRP